MAKETTVSNFKLKGREILSSYANFTLEGEITAKVTRGKEAWTITERNRIPKGTSDGENEAVYIANDKAIASIGPEHRQAAAEEGRHQDAGRYLGGCRQVRLGDGQEGAARNKKLWAAATPCLAASTAFFQCFAQGERLREAWEVFATKKTKTFYFPNIAFNMVCGGEHVPGTKQDIQEMFFFSHEGKKSVKEVSRSGLALSSSASSRRTWCATDCLRARPKSAVSCSRSPTTSRA